MASVQNRGTYVPAGAATGHAFSVTVGAGSNRRLTVFYARETSVTVTALTFDDGVSPVSFLANARASVQNTTDTTLGIVAYDYAIPDGVAAGTYDVDYTVSASNGTHSMVWVQSEGIVAGAPESTDTKQWTTTATNDTGTVTASNGAVLIGAAITGAASLTWTITGNVTEQQENNETNYTSVQADGVSSGSGSRTMTATVSAASTGNKCLVLLSYAPQSGPTITVQPTAQTKVLTNANTATFSVTATGVDPLAYDWELETSVGGGSYSNLADGNGATWTGQAASSCTGTFTTKALSGRRVRCNVTDPNGTTTSTAVALTLFDGPQVTTFPATNGSGVSTATLTCDYVTGVGEAIEVRIPLPDGDVAVTVTTT